MAEDKQNSNPLLDLKPAQIKAGMRFGRLQVIGRVRNDPKSPPNLKWRVRIKCDCGSDPMTIPSYYLVRKPNPKENCGNCLDMKSKRTLFADVYGCWYMMRTRCNNPKHVAYDIYGGRGIKVCDDWNDAETGFEAFLAYIGPRPSPTHTVDRYPNPDGNYEPGNVRWATPVEQANNKSKLVKEMRKQAKPYVKPAAIPKARSIIDPSPDVPSKPMGSQRIQNPGKSEKKPIQTETKEKEKPSLLVSERIKPLL